MSNYLLDQDTRLAIVGNMRQFGGSFVQALATCIMAADKMNLIKLESAFENYIKEYHPDNWPVGADGGDING